MAKSKINPNILWSRQTWLWPLVVLLLALGAFYTKPWQIKPAETISVSASGKTQVTPNIAKITATIESQNPNLDEARSDNEQKISTIVTKLKELGVEEKDIKTQNISGGPGYEPQILIYPPRPKNINQLSTSLEITIRNFDISDEVLATLTQSGTTDLYGPNLTVDDQTLEAAKSKAREDAVSQARKKAEELAKLSERRLGKVVKIQEQGDFGYPVPIIAQSELDLKERASQIQPGQNEVTINLSVDFALE
ncbi:hypothetical protein A3B51_02085 [Candidatus Curtissbacteria bacterium RIFCSPLOWO2_01_FULL_41_18]|uniref:DUF541 domain-containing protein n=2 Tax=Candidatus Curtissiibacteriota TaxID=1752717 RepID=A0A1F5G0N8_9BACT|nr:MAG: hypothetical protein A2696_02455 [Candidatus Curtissbacteria bacterium RIFCSPHIGHO2_01_FULL_41_13]OGE05142.1 MAG: hypothetical protein A3B51_02085 [Candidatus Curtissbacteria bacterium RIFCSPLOWO2_01_FULL_41_18]